MTPLQANGVALLAALAWGLGNVAQKTIMDHLDGFSAAGVTSLLGAVVLMPFVSQDPKIDEGQRHGFFRDALLIALLFSAAVILMQFGYGNTTVTNAGFLVNISAIFTPAIAWAIFGERLPPWTWPASFLTLAGIFMMSAGGVNTIASGDLLSLLAALMVGFWTVFLGRHMMRYRCANMLTVLQLTVCGIVSLTFGFFIYGPPSIQNLVAAWPEILLMGIISKALAYVLNSIAQQHIPASTAAVIVTSEAVFGAVFAAILLGERLSLLRGIGAALVIAGVLAISLQPSLRLGRRKSSERSLNNKFAAHQPPRVLRPGE